MAVRYALRTVQCHRLGADASTCTAAALTRLTAVQPPTAEASCRARLPVAAPLQVPCCWQRVARCPNAVRGRRMMHSSPTVGSPRTRAVEDAAMRAAELVATADAVLVTAGAGIGVDSGLPDFRGNEGFWRAYPPLKKLGIEFTDMANPQWFNIDPELAWGFYGHRLELYRRVSPHPGFAQLRRISEGKRLGGFVFTSNVDGQFQKAGFDPSRVMECHGSLMHLQCVNPSMHFCNMPSIRSAEGTSVEVDDEFRAREQPHCPCGCGQMLRPNVLMFGDGNWVDTRTRHQQHRFEEWRQGVKEAGGRLVVIDSGSGKAVPTVRMTSEHVARVHKGGLIRINPRDSDIPQSVPSGVSLATGCQAGIQAIVDALHEMGVTMPAAAHDT